MLRERALKVVLLLVGLFFVAGVYPVVTDFLGGNPSDTGDDMMLGLYVTLGVFLLVAVRNPSAHRSLIAFAAWSSFAHAVVMFGLAFLLKEASECTGFLGGSAILVVIGIALLTLAPATQPQELASAPAPAA